MAIHPTLPLLCLLADAANNLNTYSNVFCEAATNDKNHLKSVIRSMIKKTFFNNEWFEIIIFYLSFIYYLPFYISKAHRQISQQCTSEW